MNIQDEAYSEAMDEIKRLKALLTRAADALALLNRPANSPAISGLIVELRKAVR
jgi:hypothetical protein